MAKYAIASFSAGLRRELNEYNIKAITIEPALYKTPISDWNICKYNLEKVWSETPLEVQNSYGEERREDFDKKTQFFLKFTRKQTQDVVNTMIKAITLKEPKIYYRCSGPLMDITLFFLSYFPELSQDFVFGLIYDYSIYKLFVK